MTAHAHQPYRSGQQRTLQTKPPVLSDHWPCPSRLIRGKLIYFLMKSFTIGPLVRNLAAHRWKPGSTRSSSKRRHQTKGTCNPAGLLLGAVHHRGTRTRRQQRTFEPPPSPGSDKPLHFVGVTVGVAALKQASWAAGRVSCLALAGLVAFGRGRAMRARMPGIPGRSQALNCHNAGLGLVLACDLLSRK